MQRMTAEGGGSSPVGDQTGVAPETDGVTAGFGDSCPDAWPVTDGLVFPVRCSSRDWTVSRQWQGEGQAPVLAPECRPQFGSRTAVRRTQQQERKSEAQIRPSHSQVALV